jgi:ABC-type phosphate transport system auxiliary subunit
MNKWLFYTVASLMGSLVIVMGCLAIAAGFAGFEYFWQVLLISLLIIWLFVYFLIIYKK